MELISQYPLWLSLCCILAGAVYAGILYYRNSSLSKNLLYALSALRFVSVSLIAFLLLAPLIKIINRKIEKPLLIVAVDNSKSVLNNKDSVFYKTGFQEQLKNIAPDLKEKFDIKYLSFGNSTKQSDNYTFSEKHSDYSDLFTEIENKFANRNMGAVILAGDGNYNKGSNPEFKVNNISCPVYSVPLGDTVVKKDLLIKSVHSNKYAYLGNTFPVELEIASKKCSRENIVINIFKDGQKVFEQKLNLSGETTVNNINTFLEAKKPGLQKYRVAVSRLKNEVSYLNNITDFYIEVLDAREKVLIYATAPHPDIAALKQALEQNKNYELRMAIAETPKAENYNVIIVHGNIDNKTRELTEGLARKSNAGILYVLSNQNVAQNLNQLNCGVSISSAKASNYDAYPLYNNAFGYFTLSESTQKALNYFPPLSTMFGTYKFTNEFIPLFFQKLGNVNANYPLIGFNSAENKRGVILGDGLWRWRLENYKKEENHDAFNEIIQKSVQFLSIRENKSLFRVSGKNLFDETESIIFDAELYNESFELINEPDVQFTIKNSEGKSFSYTFSKNQNAYRLNAGYLPVGDYNYSTQVKVGAKTLSYKGSFTVAAINVEDLDVTVNQQLLYNISKKTNGRLVRPDQLNLLKDELLKNEDISSNSYSTYDLNEMINLKWIFLLILMLLTTEWFLRKRNGGY